MNETQEIREKIKFYNDIKNDKSKTQKVRVNAGILVRKYLSYFKFIHYR